MVQKMRCLARRHPPLRGVIPRCAAWHAASCIGVRLLPYRDPGAMEERPVYAHDMKKKKTACQQPLRYAHCRANQHMYVNARQRRLMRVGNSVEGRHVL